LKFNPRILRLIAALVIAAIGMVYLTPPLHLIFLSVGSIVAAIEIIGLVRERPGAYSLSNLKEIHEKELRRDEPEEFEVDHEGELTYCYRCDVSVPAHYAVCPQCGIPLGG